MDVEFAEGDTADGEMRMPLDFDIYTDIPFSRDLLVRHERTLHSPEDLATAIRKLQSNGSIELGSSVYLRLVLTARLTHPFSETLTFESLGIWRRGQ